MPKVLHPGYFPFCYGAEIRGEGLFPGLFFENWTALITSLGNAMGLYWRVRSFEVVGEVYNPFDPPDQPLQQPFNIIYTSTALTEEELVCYRGFEKTFGPEDFDDTTFELYPSYITPSLQTVPVYGNNVSVGVYLNVIISQSSDESSSWTSRNTGGGGRLGVTFEAFGQSIPILLYSNQRIVPELPVGENIISIRGVSYWSYGGTYDTATGLPT